MPIGLQAIVPSQGAHPHRLYPTAATAITTRQFRNASPCGIVAPRHSGTIWDARVCDLSSSAFRQACQPGSWGAYSPSPTSRAPLAVGSAANRLVHPRTSEMAASPGRPTTEWLGLRTAKAFAAAGLLGHDVNNSASRFGIVRSLGDRDQHALAPSQLSLSEVGSVASSWHSGSVSRATTHSQATSHD